MLLPQRLLCQRLARIASGRSREMAEDPRAARVSFFLSFFLHTLSQITLTPDLLGPGLLCVREIQAMTNPRGSTRTSSLPSSISLASS